MANIVLFLHLVIVLLVPVAVQAKKDNAENVEQQFEVWKHGSFHRFIVKKNLDYGQYDKLIVFPLHYGELAISTDVPAKLQRNWEDFAERDMPAIKDKFQVLVQEEFGKAETLQLTTEGGKGVLVAEFRMLTFKPKAYRDSSLDTVGQENIETVGTLQYRVTLMDSASHEVVGMIEDDIQISLRRKALNSRSNHFRAWINSMAFVLEHFHDDMDKLAEASPLKK